MRAPGAPGGAPKGVESVAPRNKSEPKIFSKSIDRSGILLYNITIKREERKQMYESDKVIGTDVREAIKWIDAKDLWDEVIEIESDATGIVTNVIH